MSDPFAHLGMRVMVGPTPLEERLEAQVRHYKLQISSFEAWLKANMTGGHDEANLMAERALAHLRTLLAGAR